MTRTKKHVTVLSLGAGIQSTALALLLNQDPPAKGLEEYERPLWAIFADTMAEPPHVYETLDWLQERISYPIVRTSWGDLGRNTWKAIAGMPVPERGHHAPGYIDLPVFSQGGIGRRQCTTVYKIRPIKKEIRRLAESAPPHLTATQYLGISTNEAKRAKPSRDAWITNSYPLIDIGWNRTDCLRWLDANHPGHPVKRSACYFCPFHSMAEWKEISRLYPNLYQDALAMDRQMTEHPRGPWNLRAGGLERAMAGNEAQLSLLGEELFCTPG